MTMTVQQPKNATNLIRHGCSANDSLFSATPIEDSRNNRLLTVLHIQIDGGGRRISSYRAYQYYFLKDTDIGYCVSCVSFSLLLDLTTFLNLSTLFKTKLTRRFLNIGMCISFLKF